MKFGKTVKRIVALGTGITMLGATIMGAMATADLGTYPSPFVKDGKFNGVLIVGANAATEDVIGAVDIATSLQFASKTTSTVNTGSTGSVGVTGDSWRVETSSSKLELGESLSSVKNTLTDSELNALSKGTLKNSKGSYVYEQGLVLGNNLKVDFVQNTDEDTMGDYVSIKNGEDLATYSLIFNTPAISDVDGTSLKHFKDKKISILGKDYSIVQSSVSGTGAELTLMGGSISETLAEGETKDYTMGGKNYEVSVVYVGNDGVKFKIMSEGQAVTTSKLSAGDSDTVLDQTIGVSEILYQSYAGGVHSVDFFFGVNKVVLKDSNTDGTFDGIMTVGDVRANDVDVALKGGYDSSGDWNLESIKIKWIAGDDYWVGKGEQLSDKYADKYKGSLINWDIKYEGLTTEPMEKTSIVSAGDTKLQLKTTLSDGEVTIPLAYSTSSSSFSLGDNTHKLVIDRTKNIAKDDYFFLTNSADTNGKSYALQYKGADSSTGDTTATMKFKNLGTGDIIEKSIAVGIGSTSIISFGGADYTVTSTSPSNAGTDDFNITVTGGVNGCIVTKEKAEVCITDFGNSAIVNITEADSSDMVESGFASIIKFNISAGTTIAMHHKGGNINLVTDPEDSDIQFGVSPYGAEYKYTIMSASPNKIEVNFPSNQRLAQAFVVSGDVQTTSYQGDGEVETAIINKIDVGAAILDREVSNIQSQNSIIVGGPCVNTAAADALGLARGSCGEDVQAIIPVNTAILKLVSFDNGNVAMIVAGWEAKDTRRACNVIANYMEHTLSGKEMRVTGTSMSDIQVVSVISTPVANITN